MAKTRSQSLRVTNCGNLVEILPFIIGFRPAESVIAVLADRRQVRLSTRHDLPTSIGQASEVGAEICDIAIAQRVTNFSLVFWTRSWTFAEPLAEVVQSELGFAACPVVLTTGEHWWELTSNTPERMYQVPTGELSADPIVQSARVYTSREALASSLVTADELMIAESLSQRALARAELAEWPVGRRLEHCRTLIARGETLDLDERIRLGMLVNESPVIEVAYRDLTRLAGAAAVDLWRSVLAVTPETEAAGALTMTAFAGWLAGNGALLVMCLGRLADLNPHPRLWAELVGYRDNITSPSAWDRDHLGSSLG